MAIDVGKYANYSHTIRRGRHPITPQAAVTAIDPDVMLFLFGMSVVGEAHWSTAAIYTRSFIVRAGALDR